ncbi:MAG: prepilin-type N-terminal cleavage/methylation domain-containing protein [Paucibacter sp.]|nr:prepilin-type N-terminal cleavage/methylation domain-containing protein [Roseateles sp.]
MTTPRAAARSRGFSMIEMLVSVLIFALAMLGLAGMYMKLITAQTQNQNVAQTSPWGNSFWGIVQANANATSFLANLSGTYTSANISAAPAPLRAWLTEVLQPLAIVNSTTTSGSPNYLANGSVVITTGPDASSGAACSASSGCTVTVTFQWTQNGAVSGSPAITRGQTFNFQIGL